MPTLLINGVHLYYEMMNEKSELGTIMFFNGVMASASSWKEQANVFEKLGYRVIMHDLRGQLKSDKPQGPYSFKQHALDSAELLKALGIEKAHCIGTSYGGEVVLAMAVHTPEVVQSVSVINSVSELDETLIHYVASWKMMAQTYDGELFFRGMLPGVYHPHYLKKHKVMLNHRAKAFNDLPKDYFDGQIALYDTFMRDLHLTPYLNTIKVPVLIVAGEEDVLKPRRFSDIMAREMPHAQYALIPECGHVTIFEKPEVLNSLLIGFILNQIK